MRIAAAGDVHVEPALRTQVLETFAGLDDRADLLLLAGDLTTHGEPEQAEVLAEAVRDLELPIVAVLGNHDWHSGQVERILPIWEEAGIRVLQREHCILDVEGVQVGIAGVKGFVGGFPGSRLPDFGEPSLRGIYAEAGEEAAALDATLRAVSHCPVRIALLHYAPTTETLVGEPEPIWTFLGTDRLAPPIAEHAPDLVLHGHAHHGTFEGRIGQSPIYNVSVPVMRRDFWVFELSGVEHATAPIH
jgi:Icc-related predicted phosphoesterase